MTDMASSPKILGVPTMISGLNGRKFLLNQRMGRLFDFDSNEISIDYLRFILSTNLIKAFYNKLGARGVQINISREQILSARIPLPPLSKQQEIANHITNIRKQAQELKDQTKSALEQANKKIEEILLGN
jgi:restriction endonuclease S subunit